MSNVALVVMERGSAWPGHVAAIEDVVAFGHEDDAQLLHKTEEKLAALESSRQGVRVAILACNEKTDEMSTHRRRRLARALLTAVCRSRFGRLVLSASSLASPSLRKELLELAGELTPELGAGSAMICLRFAEPAPGAPSSRAASRGAGATQAC